VARLDALIRETAHTWSRTSPRAGRSCVRFRSLESVDLDVLRELIREGAAGPGKVSA
jgi:hypothetical protein